jgi:SAM-dependent methyltransferase
MSLSGDVAAAYSATGAAWGRGPALVYDRLAEHLVDACPVPLEGRIVLDVGAGTGAASRAASRRGARVVAVDAAIGMLLADAGARSPSAAADALALPFPDGTFDAVVAAFSLNHLHDPAAGLAEVARVSARHVLLSTPWEPVWRILNVARGRYLRDLGNTPGHVQHFSRRGLVALAGQRLHVREIRRPLPWTVISGVVRR